MPRTIRRAMIAVFFARTATNAGLRVVYPFLPAIARGLGVSVGTMGAMIAIRNLGGLTAPLAGRASEVIGRRAMMTWSVAMVAAGCFLTVLAPALPGVVIIAGVGLVIVGVAKPAFDIAMQSWFGDRVPYSQRGRILGISELTWSLALLVTVPASGFLIAATDWRAPFALVGVLSLIGVVAVQVGIGSDRPAEHVKRPLKLTPQRIAFLVVAFSFMAASELLFVVYGSWLEDDFGLSVSAIGLFTLVIVVAELLGEGAVAWISDRLGIKRMIVLGLICSAASYAAFTIVGSSLLLALAVVALWLFFFEITIVAAIPFASELAAESRDRLLSLFSGAIALGRVTGALIGYPLFKWGGIAATGLGAGAIVLAAALLFARVSSPDAPTGPPPVRTAN